MCHVIIETQPNNIKIEEDKMTITETKQLPIKSGEGITTHGFLSEGAQRTKKAMLKSTGFIYTRGDNMMCCGVGTILIWNQMDFGIR